MPEVLSTQTEGTVSPNTDRPRPVNNIFIFFLLRFKSFKKLYFSLQPMSVEEGRVRVDVIQSARSIINQNKTLQHDFQLVMYVITIKLSLERKVFRLGRQFLI